MKLNQKWSLDKYAQDVHASFFKFLEHVNPCFDSVTLKQRIQKLLPIILAL